MEAYLLVTVLITIVIIRHTNYVLWAILMTGVCYISILNKLASLQKQDKKYIRDVMTSQIYLTSDCDA